MTLYEPAWQRWLEHRDSCPECSAVSKNRPGKPFAFYCDNGLVMLQRLEEIARLEDDE